MEGTFVEAIAKQVRVPEAHALEPGQVLLAPNDWQQVVPKKPDMPTTLNVCTLSGVRDYVDANRDMLTLGRCILTVSPTVVQLLGPLDETGRRAVYLTASANGSQFKFGQWHDMESFVIAMQTQFVKTPARDAFLTMASSVTSEGIRASDDDGFTQEVTTRRGVHIKANAKMPSPVMLAPFRAFREVEQVESPFVVRLRDEGNGPLFALMEADGGEWQVEAVARVATWLRARIDDVVVVE